MKFFLFLFLLILVLSEIKEDNSIKTETCDGSSETCSQEKNKIGQEASEQKQAIVEEQIKQEKQEDIYKRVEKNLIYSDRFLNQPLSLTRNPNSSDETSTFFDFRINKKISKFVYENGLAPYPRERFIGKQQGNFLHFLHLVYEKKLPLFFSVDQILYPYIEITKVV